MTRQAQVSVVIPTFNRQQRLHRVLTGLAQQTIDVEMLEVIVVSDGSTRAGRRCRWTSSVKRTKVPRRPATTALFGQPATSSCSSTTTSCPTHGSSRSISKSTPATPAPQ
jgi:cellulose synthase/poly-beta-1,6-N-acetylglucosamine synthase-like glycosyltransferase